MCKISVVTVTFNAEKQIAATIESVLRQDCGGFEYLIMDGLSKDRTLDISKSFEAAFEEKNIQFRIVSQEDRGIYDAMNNAATIVNGEYIHYLNAGDLYCNENVLKNVIKEMDTVAADLYYGDTILTTLGLYRYNAAAPLDTMANGIPFCHQSVFTATELLKNNGYDLKWKVCADHDFYAKLWKNGARFHYMHFQIAIYALGGASSSDDSKRYWYEKLEVAYENELLTHTEYQNRRKRLENTFKKRKYIRAIKSLMPKTLHAKRHMLALLKEGWETKPEKTGLNVNPQKISKIKRMYRKVWSVVHGNRTIAHGCTFIDFGGKIKKTRVYNNGNNNMIIIMPDCYVDNCTFHMYGDNNRVVLWHKGVYINTDFWLEDNNNQVLCEDGVRITGQTQLAATEGKSITIGKDCLFSDEIIVRTGDSHSIIGPEGTRINHAESVNIGDHVWICHGVNILKGADIPSGCVIGTGAVVGRKHFSENCIIAGNPAMKVRDDIVWSFDR